MSTVEEIKIQVEEMPLNALGTNNVNTESVNKYTMITVDDPEIRQKQEEFMQRLDELRRLGRIVLFSPSKRFCYIMGLIDYLGKWNMNKRLEMLGKSLRAHFIRQNTDFSVKPPDEFAKRFIRKVQRIFRVDKQDMLLRNAAMQLENPSPMQGAGLLSLTHVSQAMRAGTMIGYDLSPGRNGKLLEDSMVQPVNERDARTFIKPMPL